MVANGQIEIDVALVPGSAGVEAGRVLIVVDQIRASTTITTALDLGCSELLLAGDVGTARRLRDGTDRLLAGEQRAVKPPDFDFDNSPVELSRADLRGRRLVLCTTNGTAVVSQLRDADRLLIGCLRNASAVAAAALDLADGDGDNVEQGGGPAGGGGSIQVVCAGLEGRFVLDDAVAAGVIVERLVEAAGIAGSDTGAARRLVLSDAAEAAIRIRRSFPSLLAAMTDSNGGATLVRIGAPEDIAFCAEEDASATVPALVRGQDLRIVALATPGPGQGAAARAG
jgi:2-phosphosulfolactate phosphatase